MTQQPKALQLADELEMWTQGEPAAEELRRQHAEIERLRNDLAFYRGMVASVIVTAPAAADERVDAQRYRLLRRGQHWSVINGIGDVLRADALDAEIDKAAHGIKENT
jgi:hypothetical protein